jgi:hypothetical protein
MGLQVDRGHRSPLQAGFGDSAGSTDLDREAFDCSDDGCQPSLCIRLMRGQQISRALSEIFLESADRSHNMPPILVESVLEIPEALLEYDQSITGRMF